eukprot:m.10062 g.10062  ORF g.10062 m.10062 type:complete len:641 (-) comp5913_c0_seq2:409-2331(-)
MATQEFLVDKKNKRGKVQQRKIVIDEEHMVVRTKTAQNKPRREIDIQFLREINVIAAEGHEHVVKLRWQSRAPTDHPVYFLIFKDQASQRAFAKHLLDLFIKYTGFPPKGNAVAVFKEEASTSSLPTQMTTSTNASVLNTSMDQTASSSEDEGDGENDPPTSENTVLVITILGASGHLAKTKIYPVLWCMYRKGLIPRDAVFLGYARSKLSREDFMERLRPCMRAAPEDETLLDEFLHRCEYQVGSYDDQASFVTLNEYIKLRVANKQKLHSNRLFYLALPVKVVETVSAHLSSCCESEVGWTRIVVEKPFGRDVPSFLSLSQSLGQHFKQDQIYRMDHYLGKEMVQNLLVLRFSNRIFSTIWDRRHIQAVVITVKETRDLGVYAPYFDEYGIIRDVMQGHMLQLLSFVAMEKPLSGSPEDMRSAKLKCLRSVEPVKCQDVVLGQYTAGQEKPGYLSTEGVAPTSNTPTFAVACLNVRSERWDGIPFILQCGKGLNERRAEVRIQFRDNAGEIFPGLQRNELVVRVQPKEAVQLNITVKQPGISFEAHQTHLNLCYQEKFQVSQPPSASERLVLDVLQGNHANFVRDEELMEGWRIFTPLLDAIDKRQLRPLPYAFGSAGPEAAVDLAVKAGYIPSHYNP